MEYIGGGSLAQRLAESPLSSNEATTICIQIADTLAYTHSQGIVHRDLKPQNILIDESGRPRLVDFGLAKDWHDDLATKTLTGTMLGTPAYVAPEQAGSSNGQPRPTADIYSAGVVLYEMLTGELPFRGSVERVLFQVHYVEPARPGLIQENISEELETVCLKCLEKNPADRFQSAEELRDELDRIQQGKPIHSRRASVWKRVRRWSKQHRGIAAMIALSAMLLATIAIVATVAAFFLNEARENELELRLAAEDAEGRARIALVSETAALQKESNALAEATHMRQLADKQALVAVEEAKVSREAIQFLQSTFQNSDPVNAFFGGSSQVATNPVTLESLLDNAVSRIESELSDQPTTQARLVDVLANAYRAMGKFEVAETLLTKSLAIRRGLEHEGEFATGIRSRDEAAHALYCGWLAHDRSQWDFAENAYEDALTKVPLDTTRDHELLKAEILFQRGKLLIDRGKANHAIGSMQESLRLRRRWLDDDNNLTKAARIGLTFADHRRMEDLPLSDLLAIVGSNNWASEIARNYTSALRHRRNHDYEKAINCYEQVAGRLETFLPDTHPLLLLARGDFAGLLHEAGDYRRALPLAMKVLEQGEQICPDHVKLQDFRIKLAIELSFASRFDEAAELYSAVAKQENLSVDQLVKSHHGLTWCCILQDRFEEAVAHAKKACEQRGQLTDREIAWYDYSHARALAAAGRVDESVEVDRIAYEKTLEIQTVHSANWLERLSIIHAHNGDLTTAESMQRKAVEIERETRPATHPHLAARLSGHGFLLKKLGIQKEAQLAYQEALEVWQASLPKDDKRIETAKRQVKELAGSQIRSEVGATK